MRWAAVLIAAVLCAAGAAGIGATGRSSSATSFGSGNDCDAALVDQEAIAREILSFETDEPIYDEASWESALWRALEKLAQLRAAFPPAAEIGAEYKGSSKLGFTVREGALYDHFRSLLGTPPSTSISRGFASGEQTGFQALDQLRARFHVSNMTALIYTLKRGGTALQTQLCLDPHTNFRAFVSAIKTQLGIDGVYRADSVRARGDHSTLNMAVRDGIWYAVVREAGGDCPSGCTWEVISTFRIDGGQVEQMTDAQVLADPLLLELVASLHRTSFEWRGNYFTTPSPTPKPPTPATTPPAGLELPRTGGPPMPLLSPP